jgi:hypothetical protein
VIVPITFRKLQHLYLGCHQRQNIGLRNKLRKKDLRDAKGANMRQFLRLAEFFDKKISFLQYLQVQKEKIGRYVKQYKTKNLKRIITKNEVA